MKAVPDAPVGTDRFRQPLRPKLPTHDEYRIPAAVPSRVSRVAPPAARPGQSWGSRSQSTSWTARVLLVPVRPCPFSTSSPETAVSADIRWSPM